MFMRKYRLPLFVFAAFALAANLAWAIGFQLGETKKQLKLKYDVSVKDHGTGRVTVVLTVADQGRLKPLNSVNLVVPGKDKNKDDGNYVDLSVALATREEGGKQVVRVHLLRELAERAEIQLRTGHLDGRQEPLTWYYHVIPLAEYLPNGEQKKD